MMFAHSDIPRRKRGVEASPFGREYVVLDPQGTVLRGVNRTGQRVYELVDGVRTVEEISNRIATEFGAAADQVLMDVLSFLNALAERSLIERGTRR